MHLLQVRGARSALFIDCGALHEQPNETQLSAAAIKAPDETSEIHLVPEFNSFVCTLRRIIFLKYDFSNLGNWNCFEELVINKQKKRAETFQKP